MGGVGALAQHAWEHVVALERPARRVGRAVAQPPCAAARVPSATAVGRAEEATFDVHEDMHAWIVIERHLEGAGPHPARDHSVANKLRDHARVARNAGASRPKPRGDEDRGDRAGTVEPNPAVVVATAPEPDAGDPSLRMSTAVDVRVVAPGDVVRRRCHRAQDPGWTSGRLDRE